MQNTSIDMTPKGNEEYRTGTIRNKLELWESKLLDLTTRNMLLSLPKKKAVLPVMSSHIDELEDALASGLEFRLRPAPDWITEYDTCEESEEPGAGLSGAGPADVVTETAPVNVLSEKEPSAGLSEKEPVNWLAEKLKSESVYEISSWPCGEIDGETVDFNEKIRQDYKSRRLYTFSSKKQLDKDLTAVYRAARASLQENGVSSLYLAIGLLRWYATGSDGKLRTEPCYAPLILLPIEILRKPANLGYALRVRDEEPHFNLTLLEKLRRDYNLEIYGVDPLPADEYGTDISKTFSLVREAVSSLENWDVVETCVIGNFSFAQFAMWKDIHTGKAMLEGSKVVRSMMKGYVDWTEPDGSDGITAGTVSGAPQGGPADAGRDPSMPSMPLMASMDMRSGAASGTSPSPARYVPIPVDATQLHAIELASAGRTFVLHGPPGTGKSQTITGMIANLTAQGKTVLFAAEKMAALTVVQRRLDALGIGDFCLELHSDKASKKHILAQLDRALGSRIMRSESDFSNLQRRTRESEENLDRYAHSLHAVRNCGYSLRQLVDFYETVRDMPESISFQAKKAGALDRETVQSHLYLIGQLTASGAALGNMADSPLKDVGLRSYSADVRFALGETARQYADALTKMQTEFYRILNFYKEKNFREVKEPLSLSAMNQNVDLFFRKKDVDGTLWFLLAADQALIREYYSKTAALNEERDRILAIWKPELLERNLEDYLERHAAAGKKIFGRKQAMASVTAEMQAYTTMSLTYGEIPAMLQIINSYQINKVSLQNMYLSLSSGEKRILENFPDEREYDKALGEIYRFRREAEAFPGGIEAIWKFAEDPEAERIFDAYRSSYQKLCEAEKAFDELLKRRGTSGTAGSLSNVSGAHRPAGSTGTAGPGSGRESADAESWIRSELLFCDYVREHTAELKNLGIYNLAKENCAAAGLAPVVRAYESGMPAKEIPAAYKKGFCRALIDDAIGSDDGLSCFSGVTFNEAIARFKQLDDALMEQTRQEVCRILASRVPGEFASSQIGSELNILRKAIKSNGRGISIRELFSRIPNVLKLLCPCMLMSPNSAAQFLAQENGLFDVVIFDEASQLPTCKAAGAIARAENAIIVGDPRQMPPTSFFAGGGPEVDDVALYDLESILDDALALGIPSHYLQWHYRSTHESLIAFSNRQFYENKMFTFPSADDREKRVRTVHVDGLYHDGTNPDEAEAVTAEIIRRFHDPVLRQQSVGVVTFNIKQQTLIENLLSEKCQKDAALDAWVNREEDPLFVKNLENVQGDERDAILFSIGYGPDENGFVSNNFGPINQAGGGRRLNVAFSRARISMTIFASMRSTDIRITETSPEGLVAFCNFLKYADTDPSASSAAGSLHLSAVYPAGSFAESALDSSRDGILRSLCREIQKAGYRYDTMIGKSDFHVEIAVSDPNDPGCYMMGILLDGETYRQAGNARDREVAHSAVLKNLGWNLYRIWTMDWWDNRDGEIRRLLAALQNCRTQSDERAALKRAAEAAKAAKAAEEEAAEAAKAAKASPGQSVITRNLSKVTGEPVPYAFADLPVQTLTIAEYKAAENQEQIRNRILAVLRTEAPILKDTLFRRVLTSFGIAKTGAALDATEKAFKAARIRVTKQKGYYYCWMEGQNPDDYQGIRVSSDRRPDELCLQEIRNAVIYTLRQRGPLDQNALVKECSLVLGYKRLGKKLENAIGDGIQSACTEARIRPEGGLYKIAD